MRTSLVNLIYVRRFCRIQREKIPTISIFLQFNTSTTKNNRILSNTAMNKSPECRQKRTYGFYYGQESKVWLLFVCMFNASISLYIFLVVEVFEL